MNTNPKLTTEDVEACLQDDRHLGYGYASRGALAPSQQDRLDIAVVGVANEMGLDAEELFEWTNSKYGRWLADHAYGSKINRALVRVYMNEDAMQTLREGR